MNYKDEATAAMTEANADARIAAAIIQAKALDRQTAALARIADAFAESPDPRGATGAVQKRTIVSVFDSIAQGIARLAERPMASGGASK